MSWAQTQSRYCDSSKIVGVGPPAVCGGAVPHAPQSTRIIMKLPWTHNDQNGIYLHLTCSSQSIYSFLYYTEICVCERTAQSRPTTSIISPVHSGQRVALWLTVSAFVIWLHHLLTFRDLKQPLVGTTGVNLTQNSTSCGIPWVDANWERGPSFARPSWAVYKVGV